MRGSSVGKERRGEERRGSSVGDVWRYYSSL